MARLVGTTGLPKSARMSHRTELARFAVSQLDAGLARGDAFLAWAPMFHMVSIEQSIHTLGTGGTVHVANAIVYLASSEARFVTGTSLVVDGG